jgi:hypothetical protein
VHSHIRSRPAITFALLLALTLSACGIPAAPGSSGSAANATPGSAALNGCPARQPPAGWPPADVVLTETTAQGATIATSSNPYTMRATVTHGQIVDVRLRATIQWRVTTAPPANVLRLAQPAGWYDAQHRACVWRYTATASGVAPLSLSGGLVCAPRQACPALAAIASYEITVR